MVQGHGRHQQHAAPPAGGNALRRVLQNVDVRQDAVQQPEKERAQGEPRHHRGEGQSSQMGREFQGRSEQAEKGRSQHHAACRPQQTVHGPTGKFPAGKNERGPQTDGKPGQQRLDHRMLQQGRGKERFHNRPRRSGQVLAVLQRLA